MMLPKKDIQIALNWWIILSKSSKYNKVAIPEIARLELKLKHYDNKSG